MRFTSFLPFVAVLPLLLGNTSCEAPAAAAELGDHDDTSFHSGDEGAAEYGAFCAPVAPVTCGELLVGDTADFNYGATDVLDHYPIAVGNYSGAEIAYRFDPPTSGEVTFKLIAPDPTTVNHDVFVLDASEGCTNSAAIARGFNDVTFDADPAKRYYLVVDGYDGDEGLFGAQVVCDDPTYEPPAPEPEPEAASCAFGATAWETMGSPHFDWTEGVEHWTSPSQMPSVARNQLDVGWERFAGEADGMVAVWDLVDADGVRLDHLQMAGGGPGFDWLRFELRAGATFGFIFREGTLDLEAWDVDHEIQDCRVEAPAGS